MRATFDEQLTGLQREVVRMGGFVIQMLDRAAEALARHDVSLAEEVVRMDDTVDVMDMEIEANSMHLLALQQPMSRDLRTIATALRIITDVERIGDYAADIAQVVKRLEDLPYENMLHNLPEMSQRATAMVRDAVQAFVDHDIALAERVCRDDDEVDALYHRFFDDTVRTIEQKSHLARPGANLILVARRLERVADHSTNIAERVVYMETGKLEQLARAHKELWAGGA